MIALVILIGIARARVLSVTDHREKEAQGHGCGGDQEDDQTKLATGIAPGLARQPAEPSPHRRPGVSARRGYARRITCASGSKRIVSFATDDSPSRLPSQIALAWPALVGTLNCARLGAVPSLLGRRISAYARSLAQLALGALSTRRREGSNPAGD
jgi:hypothetical protein